MIGFKKLLLKKAISHVNTWTQNLISRWKFDTSTAIMLNDSYGSNNLTNSSAGWTSSGKIGGATDLNASSIAYLTITSNASLVATNTDFCWAFWCQGVNGNPPFFPQIVWKSNGGNSINYIVNFDNDTLAGHFQMNVGDGVANTVTAISTVACGTGTWHLVIAWFTIADKKCHISVDNETPIDSPALPGNIFAATNALSFGSNSSAFSTNCPVLLDDCSFWKRVLTSNERSNLWNAGSGFDYPLT